MFKCPVMWQENTVSYNNVCLACICQQLFYEVLLSMLQAYVVLAKESPGFFFMPHNNGSFDSISRSFRQQVRHKIYLTCYIRLSDLTIFMFYCSFFN